MYSNVAQVVHSKAWKDPRRTAPAAADKHGLLSLPTPTVSAFHVPGCIQEVEEGPPDFLVGCVVTIQVQEPDAPPLQVTAQVLLLRVRVRVVRVRVNPFFHVCCPLSLL